MSGKPKRTCFVPCFVLGAVLSGIESMQETRIVRNCATDLWNKIYNDNSFFYNELEAFTGERRGGESGHDDTVDCCSAAYSYLASKTMLVSDFLGGLQSVDLTVSNPLLTIQK